MEKIKAQAAEAEAIRGEQDDIKREQAALEEEKFLISIDGKSAYEKKVAHARRNKEKRLRAEEEARLEEEKVKAMQVRLLKPCSVCS